MFITLTKITTVNEINIINEITINTDNVDSFETTKTGTLINFNNDIVEVNEKISYINKLLNANKNNLKE